VQVVRRTRSTVIAVVAVVALLGAACSAKASTAPRTAPTTAAPTTSAAPTTTAPAGAPYPLTGLPLTDPAQAQHPAVVVKMDNSPWARPQVGINQADIVVELLVEGITRFALVFGSNQPTTVGPVRSARSSDIDILAGLGRPLLAWSGANPTVMKQVAAAGAAGTLVDASRGANPPQYWRDNSRQAPHNLFTSIPLLLAKFGAGDTTPPQPILPIAATGTPTPSSATTVAGVTINFGSGVVVQYAWDAAAKGWARFQIDQLHDQAHSATLDASGQQVAPPNLVVLFTPYGVSVADPKSPQARTVGSGTGLVFVGGQQIPITWSRPASTSPYTFATADGSAYTLPPGRTWLALPAVGSAVTAMDAAGAAGLLALPR
jgi:hypothetical protein